MKAKKILSIAMILVLSIVLCSCFVSCDDGEEIALTGTVTLVLDTGATSDNITTYTVDLEKAEMTTKDTVLDAVNYLNNLHKYNEEGYLAYNISSGFVNSIGNLNPNAANSEYIALFTSVEKDKDVSDYALASFKYNGKSVYYSGFGLGAMTLQASAIYYFKIVTY